MASALAFARLQWEMVTDTLFIGRRDGRFAGVIEGRGIEGWIASTPIGEAVFETMDAAKASFEGR